MEEQLIPSGGTKKEEDNRSPPFIYMATEIDQDKLFSFPTVKKNKQYITRLLENKGSNRNKSTIQSNPQLICLPPFA